MVEEEWYAAGSCTEVQHAQFFGEILRIAYQARQMRDRSRCVLPARAGQLTSDPKSSLYTNLGISTPGLHVISKSPKYSVPKMYCNGFPETLCFTRSRSSVPLASVTPWARRAFVIPSTCSRSHRSSFCAARRSRQGLRRAGRKGSKAWAFRRSELGMRGMAVGKTLRSVAGFELVRVGCLRGPRVCQFGADIIVEQLAICC